MSFRRHPVAGTMALVVIGYLWIPILAVAVNSVNRDSLMARWGGATAHWYSLAFHDPKSTRASCCQRWSSRQRSSSCS